MSIAVSVGDNCMRRTWLLVLWAFLMLLVSRSPADELTGDGRISYSEDIRPILAENCFYCHGQDPNKRMADLQLNTHAGQQDSGVIIPGDPDSSELIRRILSTDEFEKMPPADSNRSLTAAQKELLVRWVKQDAVFEDHWAFQELKRPAVPAVNDSTRIRNPIDAFVQVKLKERGLKPSPPAPFQVLARRVSLDLTGLSMASHQPVLDVGDQSHESYESLVERLLASPHYGERMALPWLDAARYADSNGFQQDGDTFQWYWRDWVVRALNKNMPFDQFITEQLAGDLLPDPSQDQKIATAFLRNHMLNGEAGAIPEEQRFNILADRVNTVATGLLGLTMGCAQCHDHKYDPITMDDFYSMMDAFNNIPEDGVVGIVPFRIRVAEPLLELVSPEQEAFLATCEERTDRIKQEHRNVEAEADSYLQAWLLSITNDESFPHADIRHIASIQKDIKRKQLNRRLIQYFIDEVAPKQPDSYIEEFILLEAELERYRIEEIPRVMVMEESKPRDAFIHERGSYEALGKQVSFHTPEFLPQPPVETPKNRLGLAQWLVSDENPLTARVIANRQWQLFFGEGLVKTSEDFGVQSDPPVHPELLDWLAFEFRESGWNLKYLHRLIVTSETYRQSSCLTPELLEKDPENRLYARASRFRLASQLIRDQALAASGLLNRRVGGKPVYPYQQSNVWDTLSITKERSFDYPLSQGDDLYRRSLYTFWRRTVAPDNMFDIATRSECQVRVSTTNTPLHALVTLNDPTYVEAARVLAERVMHAMPNDTAEQLSLAFKLLLFREPASYELDSLSETTNSHAQEYDENQQEAIKLLSVGASPRDEQLDQVKHAAMTATCLTLLNLDETLTRE